MNLKYFLHYKLHILQKQANNRSTKPHKTTNIMNTLKKAGIRP